MALRTCRQFCCSSARQYERQVKCRNLGYTDDVTYSCGIINGEHPGKPGSLDLAIQQSYESPPHISAATKPTNLSVACGHSFNAPLGRLMASNSSRADIHCSPVAGKVDPVVEPEEDEPIVPTRERRVLSLASEIVSAYITNQPIESADLPALIRSVYQALQSNDKQAADCIHRPEPAVPIRKSVFPDYIICLEDGKKLKMLKRHIQQFYGLTPDEYRTRWGLPSDYPMVAPNYTTRRSALAKAQGLGRHVIRTQIDHRKSEVNNESRWWTRPLGQQGEP